MWTSGEKTVELGREKSWEEPKTQSEAGSLELTAVLTLGRRGLRLLLAFQPRQLWKAKIQWAFLRKWSVGTEGGLSPGTWAGTKLRGVATVVWQTALQAKKESHRALLPLLTLSKHFPTNPFRASSRPQKKLWQWVSACRAHYLQNWELVLQKHSFPEWQASSTSNPRVQ